MSFLTAKIEESQDVLITAAKIGELMKEKGISRQEAESKVRELF